MERKYIFFDIDGTLLDDNPGGKILESTYRTLDKLKENGHFVAIATGRAQYMAMDAAKEAHIDCLVTDGGNGITLHNELQYIKPIDFVQANRVIDQCIEHHLPFAVALGNEAVLYTNQSDQKNQKIAFFAAGAILIAVPICILFFFLQKNFVSGLTAGGDKG